MKKILTIVLVALTLSDVTAAQAEAQYYYPSRYGGYQPYYGWSFPSHGFGSPYYNGSNDPYFNSYGPGVRQFLQMGAPISMAGETFPGQSLEINDARLRRCWVRKAAG